MDDIKSTVLRKSSLLMAGVCVCVCVGGGGGGGVGGGRKGGRERERERKGIPKINLQLHEDLTQDTIIM